MPSLTKDKVGMAAVVLSTVILTTGCSLANNMVRSTSEEKWGPPSTLVALVKKEDHIIMSPSASPAPMSADHAVRIAEGRMASFYKTATIHT